MQPHRDDIDAHLERVSEKVESSGREVQACLTPSRKSSKEAVINGLLKANIRPPPTETIVFSESMYRTPRTARLDFDEDSAGDSNASDTSDGEMSVEVEGGEEDEDDEGHYDDDGNDGYAGAVSFLGCRG